MKNKNGFTMVEILGVVVIIVLISAFSIPAINTLSRQASQNKYNNFLKVLNNAADIYIEQNFDKYNNTTVQYIYVKKLIENGYISDNLVNPQTQELVINEDGVIVITKNIDKTMSYEYSLNEQIIISSIEDLVNLATNTNNGNNYQNKIIILTKNLDFKDTNSYKDSTSTSYGDLNGDGNNNPLITELTTLAGFTPIGNNTTPFKGTFVGDGNTISNLLINRTSQSEVGLFGVIDGADINGLTLKGTIDGGNNTGLLAGKVINNSRIIDIVSESKSFNQVSASNVGGLIGYADSITLNNIDSGPIINVSASNVGGIVGNILNSNTNNLKINGTVESSNSTVGGIFGTSTNTIITNTESNGNFKGNVGVGGIAGNISASENVERNINNASITAINKGGGLFGITSNTTINNCHNAGNINSTNYVGGLIGEANGSNIEVNYSTGTISGTSYVGGLVGAMNNSTINNTYNLGNITGTSKIGGIVGSSVSSSINRSYMAGNIIGSTEIGGLIGVATNSSSVNYSYYNSNNTNQSSIIGTNTSCMNNGSSSLLEEQMLNKSSYITWNFTDVWKIDDISYPVFRSREVNTDIPEIDVIAPINLAGLVSDPDESTRKIFKGADPNNYISLKEGSNDVLYRIIAIETDGTIKVMRNSVLPDENPKIAYDSRTGSEPYDGPRKNANNTYCNYGGTYYGCNAWSKKSEMSGELINGVDNVTLTTDSEIKTYLNTTFYNTLAASTKNLIVDHEFKLTPSSYTGPWASGKGPDASTLYTNNAGANTWIGKVGLIELRDWFNATTHVDCDPDREDGLGGGYYNNAATVTQNRDTYVCSKENYMYLGSAWWTLSPYASTRNDVFNVYSTGSVITNYASSSVGVRPVFYLSSNIYLSGSGTSSDPYKISTYVNESYKYKELVLNGANPEIKTGMIPVTIGNDGTVRKADLTSEWYKYSEKRWANAVTVKENSRHNYMNASAGTQILENDILTYFVWIPRYKYKLWYTEVVDGTTILDTSKVHNIDIVFEDKFTTKSTGSTNGTYLTHPAFTFGNAELNGIWVGKFETGYSGATSASMAQVNALDGSKVTIKPNVYSWRGITLSNMYNTVKKMNDTDNIFGINNTSDIHMMKNMEWGAVAYLAHSVYGRGIEEIYINSNSNFITGCGGETASEESTTTCQNAFGSKTNGIYNQSTTGNISGIFDMSGGANECVMGYTTGASTQFGSSGFAVANFPDSKYVDIYTSTSDNQYSNRKLGDATGEMGPFYKNENNRGSWFEDRAYSIQASSPWYLRGGYYHYGTNSGIFTFHTHNGSLHNTISFRAVIV